MQKKLSRRGATIFLLLFGLIFASVGGGITYFSYKFAQTAVATTGVVIKVTENRSTDSDGSTSVTYKPTVSFTDQNGVSRTAETFLSSSGYNYARGTSLRILYDPENPSSMRLDSWFALWGFGLIFLVVGLGVMAIALFVVRKAGNKSGQQFEQPEHEPEDQAPAHYSYRARGNHETETREPTVRR